MPIAFTIGWGSLLVVSSIWIWFPTSRNQDVMRMPLFTAEDSRLSQCCNVDFLWILINLLVLMNPSVEVMLNGAVSTLDFVVADCHWSALCCSIEESNNVMECLPHLFGRLDMLATLGFLLNMTINAGPVGFCQL